MLAECMGRSYVAQHANSGLPCSIGYHLVAFCITNGDLKNAASFFVREFSIPNGTTRVSKVLSGYPPRQCALFALQAAIYECGTRVAGEDITGEVEVDPTQDYTGLVRDRKNSHWPLATCGDKFLHEPVPHVLPRCHSRNMRAISHPIQKYRWRAWNLCALAFRLLHRGSNTLASRPYSEPDLDV